MIEPVASAIRCVSAAMRSRYTHGPTICPTSPNVGSTMPRGRTCPRGVKVLEKPEEEEECPSELPALAHAAAN
jgi:hypothetical protein